jgi:hypothetical protein
VARMAQFDDRRRVGIKLAIDRLARRDAPPWP